MKRREFIAGLGGAAFAWPLAARGETRIRRVGVLMDGAVTEAGLQSFLERERIGEFTSRLRELGWIEGRNIRIEYRFAANEAERVRSYARELVALEPEVIFAQAPVVKELKAATGTIPIVFAGGADPVAEGLVTSLARPGGNITGFSNNPASIATKRLQLLKEIAPRVTRVALMYDPVQASGSLEFLAELHGIAPSMSVEVIGAPVLNIAEIEASLAGLAGRPNGGLVVYANGSTVAYLDTIIAEAAKHDIPAIYRDRHYVVAGGLASYGTDGLEGYRGAATYVDRILKGAKPGDLPVQQPTRFQFVLNLKTANALGLVIPTGILAIADEVIE
jgi:putative tryptophan/tyrosine transport system substrate-binding protein